MTLEFGEPHLHIQEPREVPAGASERVRKLLSRRHVIVRGQWHLWIYCCAWEVYTGDTLIGDSDLEGSTKERIELGAAELNGQRLMRVDLDPGHGTSVFHFDLGSRLETRPYEHSKQWMLYRPDGTVLSYRADGWYSLHRSDCPPDEYEWHPLVDGRRPPLRER